MIAIVFGILALAFAVYAVLPLAFPLGLNWGPQLVAFLQGGGPLLALMIGLLALLIGLADLKDKAAAKKEAAEEAATQESKAE